MDAGERTARRIGAAPLVAALVVAVVYFWNLGAAPLWGDEASTGIYARSIAREGVPSAFDGRNVTAYGGGTELNADLLVVKVPWAHFYLGGLSVLLFGDSPWGARALFALVGVLAFVPLVGLLRGRVPAPAVVAALVLLVPQAVLFQRSARYYSLLTLLYAWLLVWQLREDGSRLRRRGLGAALFVLLFHTHPVAAASCALAAALDHAVRRTGRALETTVLAGVGFASWLGWYLALGPLLVEPPALLDLEGGVGAWLGRTGAALGAAAIDLDAVQTVPLLAWGGLLVAGAVVARARLREGLGDPLCTAVLLSLALHTTVVAATFGTETADRHSFLRYMPHLTTLGLLPLLVVAARVLAKPALWTAVVAVILGTNALSWTHWSGALGREVPLTWLPAVYGEVLGPRPHAWDRAVEELRARARDDRGTLALEPAWLQERAIWDLGDVALVLQPELAGSAVGEALRRATDGGYEALRAGPPAYFVGMLGTASASVDGYERIEVPAHRERPDDGSRPELTRHTFPRAEAVGSVFLFVRRESPRDR